MNIVLLEPEIPLNTGNIGRTCVVTDTSLHMIRPFGFHVDDRSLKRSGLDYWDQLDVYYYDSFDHFVDQNRQARIFLATTKAKQVYTDICYTHDDFIMFGKESAGIPEEILVQYENTAIRIPMLEQYRSLNLANSVAIVLYEALRQNNFTGLRTEGELHRLNWSQ